MTLQIVTRQLTDRYRSHKSLPSDDDVVQYAVISLHPVVVYVGDDMVGQGHLGKALPHSLKAGYLLLGHLLGPILQQGYPLQGHRLLQPPPTHLLLPTAFAHTPAQILLYIKQPLYTRPTYSNAQDSNLLVHLAADSKPQQAKEGVLGGGVHLGGHRSRKHVAGLPPAAMLPLIIVCLHFPLEPLGHKHPLLQARKRYELQGQ